MVVLAPTSNQGVMHSIPPTLFDQTNTEGNHFANALQFPKGVDMGMRSFPLTSLRERKYSQRRELFGGFRTSWGALIASVDWSKLTS